MSRRRLGELALALVAVLLVNAVVLGALRWDRSSRFDGAWIGTAGPMRVTITLRVDDGRVAGYGGWTRDSTSEPLTITGIQTGEKLALQFGRTTNDYLTYQATLQRGELRGLLYVPGRSLALVLRRP
jgi:hypothetical protein